MVHRQVGNKRRQAFRRGPQYEKAGLLYYEASSNRSLWLEPQLKMVPAQQQIRLKFTEHFTGGRRRQSAVERGWWREVECRFCIRALCRFSRASSSVVRQKTRHCRVRRNPNKANQSMSRSSHTAPSEDAWRRLTAQAHKPCSTCNAQEANSW